MSEEDPFALFQRWLEEATKSEPNDPNAMTVVSVGADGMPSARMVLLRGLDSRGFVFFTNFESRKGRELQAHPRSALCFHWKSLKRQVRVEGDVEIVSDEEADAYFASRARGSQIGAWASIQSQPMEGRFDLEKRVAMFTAKFGVGRVPRPPHWSGFRIVPLRIEFWQDKPFRLHDRRLFHREGSGWRAESLYP